VTATLRLVPAAYRISRPAALTARAVGISPETAIGATVQVSDTMVLSIVLPRWLRVNDPLGPPKIDLGGCVGIHTY
jgi:hypothetical protein